MAETNGDGKKVVIHAIALGVAAFVEQVLTDMVQRLLNWAKTWRRRPERSTKVKPQQ